MTTLLGFLAVAASGVMMIGGVVLTAQAASVLGKVPDIKILDQGVQGIKVEGGAGRYHFEMPWKEQ